ncbi:MAG: DUF2065 domain-containing protein [Rhodobacteraceae bacterium]|nr:DUF2065 domain-containing protein [Paracoccaceae bacterium]
MIDEIIFGLGMVAVIEGLVLALAPRWLEKTLHRISSIPIETRKMMGLGLIAVGVLILWTAKSLLS